MADKIIIFSGKQYSGKDTVAKVLLDNMPDYERCAMGDVIKKVYGSQKNLTLDEIERNKHLYRQDLIELGNWGRSIDQDYWLKKIITQEGKIIVTDVRVPHELQLFKAHGATTVRVEASRENRAARGKLVGEDDVTETGLDSITDWDYVIENDSDVESLKQKAMDLVGKLQN